MCIVVCVRFKNPIFNFTRELENSRLLEPLWFRYGRASSTGRYYPRTDDQHKLSAFVLSCSLVSASPEVQRCRSVTRPPCCRSTYCIVCNHNGDHHLWILLMLTIRQCHFDRALHIKMIVYWNRPEFRKKIFVLFLTSEIQDRLFLISVKVLKQLYWKNI